MSSLAFFYRSSAFESRTSSRENAIGLRFPDSRFGLGPSVSSARSGTITGPLSGAWSVARHPPQSGDHRGWCPESNRGAVGLSMEIGGEFGRRGVPPREQKRYREAPSMQFPEHQLLPLSESVPS